MPERTCSIDECDAPVVARGWCRKHYVRWHRHGDPLADPSRRRFCEVPGCDRRRYGRGMCELHYRRWWSYGSVEPRPDPRVRPMVDGRLQCSRCSEWKTLEAFHRDVGRRHGRASMCRQCVAADAESARERSRRRRARKAGTLTVQFSDAEIFERDGWRCGICDLSIDRLLRWPHPGSPSIDHVIPLAHQGEHVPENVQASHLRCNQQKHTSHAP